MMSPMAGKTAYAEAMDAIVRIVAPTLKARGFRKRDRTFNRSREEGVVAVLNFQMGPFDPPGTYEIPGLRDNLYGQFAVNLGIAFEEVWPVDLHDKPFPSFVPEYACHLRLRLGELMPAAQDRWWPLGGDVALVGSELAGHIERYALPWLDRFGTRSGLIEAWERHERIGSQSRLPLVTALVYLHQGDTAKGRALFREWYVKSPSAHQARLRALAPELGIDDLAPPP